MDCSKYLSKFIGDKTRGIMLIHLSEDNNCPEKALEVLNKTLEKKGQVIEHIYIAAQDERTDLIEV